MSSETAQAPNKVCPVCGMGRLRTRLVSERYEHADRGVVVVVETEGVPIEDCDHCGESFSGPEAVRIRHEALGRALGLLTPAEIVEIRNQAHLSHEEFASLIGVDEKDVSLWEQGRLWQDRAVDNLLRVLSKIPEASELLQSNKTRTMPIARVSVVSP
jgi:putative zinc finger/helix-turn-helix YgiT family protein